MAPASLSLPQCNNAILESKPGEVRDACRAERKRRGNLPLDNKAGGSKKYGAKEYLIIVSMPLNITNYLCKPALLRVVVNLLTL